MYLQRENGPRREETAKERTLLIRLFPSGNVVRAEEFGNPRLITSSKTARVSSGALHRYESGTCQQKPRRKVRTASKALQGRGIACFENREK